MLINTGSNWGPPQIPWTPKPWLLGTELCFPRNLNGCLALKWVSEVFSKSCHLLSFPFSIPFLSLNSHCSPPSPLPTKPQGIIIKLPPPLPPWGRGFIRKLIIYPILIFHGLRQHFRVLSLLKMQIPGSDEVELGAAQISIHPSSKQP